MFDSFHDRGHARPSTTQAQVRLLIKGKPRESPRRRGSLKGALYARVSTDDWDQNPETQLLILRDFCKVCGHEIVEEFVDEGKFGKDPNRPAFKALLEEAKDEKDRRFDAVVRPRLSCSRRPIDAVSRPLSGQGSGLRPKLSGIDTTRSSGLLF